MKLWQKIYLFSMLLLIFTLNISGFLLVQRFHNHLIKVEVDKCLTQQQRVLSELSFNTNLMMKYSSSIPFSLERSISSLMSPYGNSLTDGVYQILDTQHNVIYTDTFFPVPASHKELENLSTDITNYIIRSSNHQYYLYIAQLSEIHHTPIILYYAKDLSSLYAEKHHYYNFFIKLDIIICCVFAFFMFFISRLITNPISTLITSTKQISLGKYSERVILHSNDEFKILAEHFNSMAQTVEDKIKDLELSNENKETFIHNFTHELKTPLTSIIGYANLMRSAKYNEAIFIQATDYIYTEGKRLEQMAFKMMDLIYADTQKIQLVPKDLLKIIIDTKASFEPKLHEHEIEVNIQGPSTILMLDEILIHMLISNLLENAIKASSPCSSIEITILPDTQTTTLSIRDHGIGIPAEHLSQLCDAFYVVDKARSRAYNGAGIGLSICQKIATLHHATLAIESQPGEGTTLLLTFPSMCSSSLV
ncbi:MAG: HAMP domain-containing histidine kinase [Cellulosilyticum sp.]|nr:HAMP domain-containing histidine kinase [Cellulosilyticum sp.]